MLRTTSKCTTLWAARSLPFKQRSLPDWSPFSIVKGGRPPRYPQPPPPAPMSEGATGLFWLVLPYFVFKAVQIHLHPSLTPSPQPRGVKAITHENTKWYLRQKVNRMCTKWSMRDSPRVLVVVFRISQELVCDKPSQAYLEQNMFKHDRRMQRHGKSVSHLFLH